MFITFFITNQSILCCLSNISQEYCINLFKNRSIKEMSQKKSKNPPKKKQRLIGDVGAPGAITITSKYEKYKGADLIMTDSINGKKFLMEAQGKLFWYKVHEFDKDKEVFTLEYQFQAIDDDVDGSEFTAFDNQTTEVLLKQLFSRR